MPGQEFEVKVLDVNPVATRKMLESHGCTLVHGPKLLKRSVFHLCDRSVKGYGRVRDDGKSVSITCKLYKNPDYPEEYEVTIHDSYDEGCKLVEALGLTKKAEQESIREKWSHPIAHEITIDIIPGLPPYMELDCETEENLEKLKKLLDVDESKIRTGAYDKTYNEYYGIPVDVINNKTPFLTFKGIHREITPTKNKALLKKLHASYKGDFVNKLYGHGKRRQTRKRRQ